MKKLGQLDWEDLRIFLAIARTGTLTAAAEALKISQPTTGRRLRTLEEACGYVLFQRTSHGFFLTDEGKLIRLHAERMEEEAMSLERRLLGAGGTVEGKLRLSASEWFSRLVLTPAISAFCRENPNVSIELLIESRVVDLGSVDKRSLQAGLDVIQRWSLRRPVDAWRPDGRGMGDHWRPAAA